jgi:hypothetical protein
MKRILFVLSLTFFLTSLVYGDIFVIYKNDTKKVYTASEKDDCLVPTGHTKVILKGGFSDYDFQYPLTDYKWQNNKLVVNTKKINDEEQKKQEQAEKDSEEKIIQDRITQIAVEELKKEGKILKYH